jgi:hypothetical protein
VNRTRWAVAATAGGVLLVGAFTVHSLRSRVTAPVSPHTAQFTACDLAVGSDPPGRGATVDAHGHATVAPNSDVFYDWQTRRWFPVPLEKLSPDHAAFVSTYPSGYGFGMTIVSADRSSVRPISSQVQDIVGWTQDGIVFAAFRENTVELRVLNPLSGAQRVVRGGISLVTGVIDIGGALYYLGDSPYQGPVMVDQINLGTGLSDHRFIARNLAEGAQPVGVDAAGRLLIQRGGEAPFLAVAISMDRAAPLSDPGEIPLSQGNSGAVPGAVTADEHGIWTVDRFGTVWRLAEGQPPQRWASVPNRVSGEFTTYSISSACSRLSRAPLATQTDWFRASGASH